MSLQPVPVIVVGGGPYGLSLSAHLRTKGVEHRIFGRPMSAWAQHMPRGMYLKSEGFASNLGHPGGTYTLREYCSAQGLEYADLGKPVPLETFVAYGQWFQRELVPDLEQSDLVALDHLGPLFRLQMSDGSEIFAEKVVLATGNLPFSYLPPVLGALPNGSVSHSSAHNDLRSFGGRDVTVVGGGASALDTAALLHQAGARVRVLVRSGQIVWNTNPEARGIVDRIRRPTSGLGTGWSLCAHAELPDLFRYLPARKRLKIVGLTLGPAGGWSLRERVDGQVAVLTGCEILSAEQVGSCVILRVRNGTGGISTIETDHVIGATGYRVDLGKLPFLDRSIRDRIETLNGSPVLSRYFEASVPGLHFIGLAAAVTFGPVQRFVYGARFTASRVSGRLARSRELRRSPGRSLTTSEA